MIPLSIAFGFYCGKSPFGGGTNDEADLKLCNYTCNLGNTEMSHNETPEVSKYFQIDELEFCPKELWDASGGKPKRVGFMFNYHTTPFLTFFFLFLFFMMSIYIYTMYFLYTYIIYMHIYVL